MTKSNLNDVIDKEKLLILSAFIKNAPFDGWGNDNLINSAKECEFEENYILILFPGKIKDFTAYFYQNLNDRMTENYLKNESIQELRIPEKIAYLIEFKFAMYNQNKEAIRSLFQYNLLPQNIFSSKKALWEVCNQIWYLVGDKSVDYNFYSKRILLEYVYSVSFLYWLSDDSKDFQETKIFIKKKLQEVSKIGKLKIMTSNFFKNLCNPF
jgi:ubiquinone biosynthesis protein COQ9